MEKLSDPEESNYRLLSLLPKEQLERVLNQRQCDIEPDFLGFIDVYEHLAQIIPLHFTVIDLGCAYNPQCFLFIRHKKYIAVDLFNGEKFKSENCDLITKSIEQFIQEDLIKYDLNETFAICSYVGTDLQRIVQSAFKNVFTYYPCHKEAQNKLHDAISGRLREKNLA